MKKKKLFEKKSFIPACISFGPIFIVLGLSSDHAMNLFAIAGALMLAVGCALLFQIVITLERKVDILEKKGK